MDPQWNTDLDNPNAKPNTSKAGKWDWAFILLVEDGEADVPAGKQPERFRLLVADKDADFLLKMPPTEYVL